MIISNINDINVGKIYVSDNNVNGDKQIIICDYKFRGTVIQSIFRQNTTR